MQLKIELFDRAIALLRELMEETSELMGCCEYPHEVHTKIDGFLIEADFRLKEESHDKPKDSDSKALMVLDDALSRKEKLSDEESFDLSREVRLQASIEAIVLTAQNDLEQVVTLYNAIADKFEQCKQKTTKPYKLLFESAAQFWRQEAERIKIETGVFNDNTNQETSTDRIILDSIVDTDSD